MKHTLQQGSLAFYPYSRASNPVKIFSPAQKALPSANEGHLSGKDGQVMINNMSGGLRFDQCPVQFVNGS
ncbi:MAG: hypothetical protein ABIN01_10625 [Ferruginibacter sp.]